MNAFIAADRSHTGSGNILSVGDPAPWISQQCQTGNVVVDYAAGRYIVLCFFLSAADVLGKAALACVERNRALFDDKHVSFFGVSMDPADATRVKSLMPGVRFMWDFDRKVCRLFGLADESGDLQISEASPMWVVIGSTWHIIATFPFHTEASKHQPVFEFLRRLPPPYDYAGFELPPPILVLPHVFDGMLCEQLIELYESQGNSETGLSRGTSIVIDNSYKKRRDHVIQDKTTIDAINRLFQRRVFTEIRRRYSCDVSYIERYIVGSYRSQDGGFFRPHRDNNHADVAYRKFAVSINLNGDFEGGSVSFPEYGTRSYKVPPGWATVFPCALLHSVSRVVSGNRYAFLPFVYDAEGALLRDAVTERVRQLAASEPSPAAERN
jgi:peroxiredoxin/predicted 2-oxoglutarate/Fe(II)-dependent dioxygenase YbiX